MQKKINEIQNAETLKRKGVRKKWRKRRGRRKGMLIAVLLIIFLIPSAAGILVYQFHPVVLKETTVQQELGKDFYPEENIRYVFGGDASQVLTEGKPDITKTGDYPVKYKFRGQTSEVTVQVRDTTAPELAVRSYTADLTEELRPELFVQSVEDASEVSLAFAGREEWSRAGTYQVDIVAEDASGNKTVETAQLVRIKDETPPQIAGADEVRILQGKTMDFQKGITVNDDMDPAPVFEVDSKQVDLNSPGTYTAVYTAKDRSGNESRVDRRIIVEKNEELNQKIVYLTFDDGPSENTGKVLDILKEYNVKATFFVTGNNQKYDGLMKRAHDEGHTIGLHTYSHNYGQVYASEDAYFQDLQKISDLVEKVTGEKSCVIRFPGGSSNTVSAKYKKGLMTVLADKVHEKGYEYFDWNCDSTDASGNNVPVDTLVKNATSSTSQHINILMHDTDAKDTTVQALPKIIEHYRQKGYTFRAININSFTAHHGINN